MHVIKELQIAITVRFVMQPLVFVLACVSEILRNNSKCWMHTHNHMLVISVQVSWSRKPHISMNCTRYTLLWTIN